MATNNTNPSIHCLIAFATPYEQSALVLSVQCLMTTVMIGEPISTFLIKNLIRNRGKYIVQITDSNLGHPPPHLW
jgi:hypothetical protein